MQKNDNHKITKIKQISDEALKVLEAELEELELILAREQIGNA